MWIYVTQIPLCLIILQATGAPSCGVTMVSSSGTFFPPDAGAGGASGSTGATPEDPDPSPAPLPSSKATKAVNTPGSILERASAAATLGTEDAAGVAPSCQRRYTVVKDSHSPGCMYI